jgi:hypothetical protein
MLRLQPLPFGLLTYHQAGRLVQLWIMGWLQQVGTAAATTAAAAMMHTQRKLLSCKPVSHSYSILVCV